MTFLRSLGVLLLACVSCHSPEPPGERTATAVRVEAVANSTDLSATRYAASIRPATQVDLAFRVGGYVDSIPKVKGADGRLRILQEGDHVSRGAPLASIRTSDYHQRFGEAKAALAEASAAREQAQIDFDRASKLAANQSIAQSELDAARARLETATARVEGAGARRDQAATALSDCELRAPIDGVILRRGIEVGSLAAPGTPAFSVADVSVVKVVFGVPDAVVDSLKLGATQTVQTEGDHGDNFSGVITRVAPSADARSRVFEIEVSIVNDRLLLRPGMVAHLALSKVASNTAPRAALPIAAIVRSPKNAQQYAVFVVEVVGNAKVAHLREVELGEYLGNLMPIQGGVRTGEQVVVTGASLLSDGQPVEVIP